MPDASMHDYWTLEDVERLMDERPGYTPRYELLDGELLVTPAPSVKHQRIVGDLYMLLRPFIDHHRLGEARMSPGDVRLAPGTRFEPDVYVVPAANGRRPKMTAVVTSLLLAAEVVSPSSAQYDRVTKRRFFQAVGVPEYWVVDGESAVFEIWHPEDGRPVIIDDGFVWRPSGSDLELSVDVSAFFAAVADEPE